MYDSGGGQHCGALGQDAAVISAWHAGVLVQVLAVMLPIQLPANVPRESYG